MFDLDLKQGPVKLNEGPVAVSQWLRGAREPKPEERDVIEETMETSLRGIWVEHGAERKQKDRAYEPFVMFRLPDELAGGLM